MALDDVFLFWSVQEIAVFRIRHAGSDSLAARRSRDITVICRNERDWSELDHRCDLTVSHGGIFNVFTTPKSLFSYHSIPNCEKNNRFASADHILKHHLNTFYVIIIINVLPLD